MLTPSSLLPALSHIAVVLGTRPELIKMGPVIQQLRHDGVRVTLVNTGQHSDLLTPLFELFQIRPDHDLEVMHTGQSLNQLGARLQERLDAVLAQECPDLVLVQGDTASALMGGLAAFNRHIPVGHVEAGLRSGIADNPFPEEMNRRLIGRLASWHFAATERNRATLLAEGIDDAQIVLTGNPVIDALFQTRALTQPGPEMLSVRDKTANSKIVLVTTHRRENQGSTMRQHLRALRGFVEERPDVSVVFPVHPSPAVKEAAAAELSDHGRVHLIAPMGYRDFVHLLSSAWMVVSDSGGIQEEATALGKPMLVLRSNTERPEAVESGIARLAGDTHLDLKRLLLDAAADEEWFAHCEGGSPVFGDGTTAQKISQFLLGQSRLAAAA